MRSVNFDRGGVEWANLDVLKVNFDGGVVEWAHRMWFCSS